VDLTAGVLSVRRSRVWLAGGFVDNAPKTLRGERTVTLDTVTVERLKAMRAVHAAERLALGVGLTGGDVLAANEDGTALRPEHLTTEWRRLCARASEAEQAADRPAVPYLGLHAARHAQVKTLRAAGLPDGVIAARLGHDENVMRATYGVPHAAEQAAAAEVMARLLG
jgi:integrase